jgi:fluoride exporter
VTVAIWVSLAAAVGAVCRYLLDQAVQRRHRSSLPWGTFTINISGSFALGLVTGLALHHGLATTAATTLGTGFIGGYTTWSTYIWESYALAENGDHRGAAANVVGSVVLGLAAAAAGLGLALL